MGYTSYKSDYSYEPPVRSTTTKSKKSSSLNEAKKLVTKYMEILSDISSLEEEKESIDESITKKKKELSELEVKIKSNKELISLINAIGSDGLSLKLK